MDPSSGGLLDFFKGGDPVAKCLEHASLRGYVADAAFCAKLRSVRVEAAAADTPQKVAHVARELMKDPRLTQCAMSANGVALSVDPQDLKKAERSGDIEKPSPLVLDDMLQAEKVTSGPAECKALGNEAYARGEHARALAFWARSLRYARDAGRADSPDFAANVYSNIAQALLKLGHPARAVQAATHALANLDDALACVDARRQADERDACFKPASPVDAAAVAAAAADDEKAAAARRKALYRRALARQASSRAYVDSRADIEAALALGAPGAAERSLLEKEAARIERLINHQEETRKAKLARRAEESVVSQKRVEGVKLKDKAAVVESTAPGATMGYIEERDRSQWATRRLAELLGDVNVDLGGGASVRIESMLEGQSTISASVVQKRGKRALYYEIDVHSRWIAEPAPEFDLSPSSSEEEGPRPLRGMVRLYNVSHETRYEPGADPTLAYMYQLGYEALKPGWFDGEKATPDAPPWVKTLVDGAHELYEAAANKADILIKELNH